jgi:hypothetical protein
MHAMILVGPVIWALATPAIRAALPAHGSSLWGIAQVALVISAYTLGRDLRLRRFVAPVFAETAVAAGRTDPLMLASFRANQVTVIKTGLISWILNGIAIVLFSIGLCQCKASRTCEKQSERSEFLSGCGRSSQH